jgi:hypothetical protein
VRDLVGSNTVPEKRLRSRVLSWRDPRSRSGFLADIHNYPARALLGGYPKEVKGLIAVTS